MRRCCFIILPLLGLFATGCSSVPQGDPFAPTSQKTQGQPLLTTTVGAVGDTFGLIGDGLSAIGLSDEPTPREYAGLIASDASTPDQRRRGVQGLVKRSFGKQPPYTELYAELAAEDPNALVQATSVRALNRSRAKAETDVLIARLSDPSPLVRLEAAKALGNLPDPAAAGELLQVATNAEEDLDVRLAAVSALRHYRDRELIERLAALLENDEFSLVFQARAALVNMTGVDLGYDPEAWANVELPTTQAVGDA